MILAVGVDVWPQLETRHFLVVSEPTSSPKSESLADWDAMLRRHIAQLDATFAPLFGGQTLAQAQPPLSQKPILLLCADKTSYLKRIAEYGIADPATAVGSGGYYHPDANVIFTWRQPTDYYTRHVVLHEVAHWYCLQLLGVRYGKMPLWLCEGLADHAAFHVWDGQTLQAMRLPRVTLENYPARLDALLKRIMPLDSASDISLKSVSGYFERLRIERRIGTSEGIYDEYALAWGMVAFLVDEYAPEMTRFFENLDRNDASDSWQAAFDDATPPTLPLFADWVAEHQHPWRWVWNHWEDTGTQLVGISDSTALIVHNPAFKPRRTIAPNSEVDDPSEVILLRCEVKPLLDRTVIGLVFRYESNDCFEMLQFRNIENDDTEWRHVRLTQNQWEAASGWQSMMNAERKMPNVDDSAAHHGVVLEIRRAVASDGQKLRFFYKGRTVADNDRIVTEQADDAGFPFGLAVQSGAAQFRDVTQ